MLGRRLLVVTNYPMVYMLEVDNNTFQKIKVQFRKTGAKLTEATNRISNIR